MTASDDARLVREAIFNTNAPFGPHSLHAYLAWRDERVAALDRLVARVEQLEQMHREQEKRANRAEARLRDAPLGGDGSHWDDCWRSHIDCAVARVEQAERERDEAQRLYGMEANERRSSEAKASNLAPYVKRAQAAEADYAGAVEALEAKSLEYLASIEAAEARNAALTAALRAIVDYEWHPGQPTEGVKPIARAALAAADRPEGTCQHRNVRIEWRDPSGPDTPNTSRGQWYVCADCRYQWQSAVSS